MTSLLIDFRILTVLWCLLLAKALKPKFVIQPQVAIGLWVAEANFHGETDLMGGKELLMDIF